MPRRTGTLLIEREHGSASGPGLDVERSAGNRGQQEVEWGVDVRLIPPPARQRRIKAKIRFVGGETPRVVFDESTAGLSDANGQRDG